MSLGLIITGALCLFLFIIILVAARNSKRKKQNTFLNPLNSLAEGANCKISQYDIWNDSVIGIDNTRNFVFAIRKTIDNETSVTINLAEVFRCRIAEVSRTTGPKEGNFIAFDRIDLVFMCKDKSKADIVVEFYNANTDRLTLTGELQLAQKWCMLINNITAALSK
jgi:hypothetical protein